MLGAMIEGRTASARREPLRDGFGRAIDYLRVSLTDRCNLRCVYCMPEGPLSFLHRSRLLAPAEIETVVRAALSVGFRKVRFTGGEPTLRAEVIEIVGRVAALPGLADLAMTTNGVRLPELAEPLARAGLRRVNVHVDSLDPDGLPRIMRRGSLARILAGIEAAEAAGLRPVKLNCVVARGLDDGAVVDLARLALDRDWTVRFIELMPLGEGEPAVVSKDLFVSSAETRARLEEALGPLEPLREDHPSDEARNFRVPGARGRIGFISPVSEPYCETCNRMRVTADGRLHLCLLRDDEMDLRAALRGGGGEAAVAATLARAVEAKPTGHELAAGRHAAGRDMFQIGG
jgi:cyclic pyranopterin phosphate synthase